MAVAYGLGYPMFLGSETFNVPDLPNDIQVRLIGVDHYGLRVYPQHDGKGDEPHWKVVGVVILKGEERKPPWRIPGWIIRARCSAGRMVDGPARSEGSNVGRPAGGAT